MMACVFEMVFLQQYWITRLPTSLLSIQNYIVYSYRDHVSKSQK
jgi:hypothetical protein